ncbi:substrate-binding domain-containing protein [Streptomyces longwoodensis]|uniref:sugar ABC transporter substrate-binding protein n=1 Tax=Streptomyces longwoodensis TaxID=68231 RepID=UPI0034060962
MLLAKIGYLRRGGVAPVLSKTPESGEETTPSPSAPGSAKSRRSRTVPTMATGVAAAMAFSLAACGSGSDAGSASSAASGKGANVAAAKKAIEPYSGHAAAFPVTQPLSKPLPPGTKFAFLQCGTAACGLTAKLLKPAVKEIGGSLTTVSAGTTAQSMQAAVSSVLSLKPAAVVLSGIDPNVFGGGLKKLTKAGIKVVTISVARDTAPYGITFNYIGLQMTQTAGRAMADWVIANKGSKADVVFYGVPGIDFSSKQQQAFEQELRKNCPGCKVRAVHIDVATLGTTSARTVVTDLQSHPRTNVAVFASAEVAHGLPAAMKAAGLSVTTLGYAPQSGALQDIKDGGMTAGLAADFPISVWTAVDASARLIEGDKPTAAEQAGEVPIQLLEQKDITFDPSRGWSAYPDYQQRFAKLWHPAG